jgi:hypothetical protein
MSYNLGDTFYPHHPDGSPAGDLCKNTRYTTGGDVFYQVVDEWNQGTSWDILNTFVQNTAWDILNDFDQDTSWDILNAWAQATAWDILNEWKQDTSWNIHPAIINYIAQFILKYIRRDFELRAITSDFALKQIKTNFGIAMTIDDNVSLTPFSGDMSFSIVPITTTFTLRNQLVSNFKITRTYDNTRTP